MINFRREREADRAGFNKVGGLLSVLFPFHEELSVDVYTIEYLRTTTHQELTNPKIFAQNVASWLARLLRPKQVVCSRSISVSMI